MYIFLIHINALLWSQYIFIVIGKFSKIFWVNIWEQIENL